MRTRHATSTHSNAPPQVLVPVLYPCTIHPIARACAKYRVAASANSAAEVERRTARVAQHIHIRYKCRTPSPGSLFRYRFSSCYFPQEAMLVLCSNLFTPFPLP
jgi:hypothetical protein